MKRVMEFASSIPVALSWVNYATNPLKDTSVAYYRWQHEANTVSAFLLTIFFIASFVGKEFVSKRALVILSFFSFSLCAASFWMCFNAGSQIGTLQDNLAVEVLRRKWEAAYVAMLFFGGASVVLAASAFAKDRSVDTDKD